MAPPAMTTSICSLSLMFEHSQLVFYSIILHIVLFEHLRGLSFRVRLSPSGNTFFFFSTHVPFRMSSVTFKILFLNFKYTFAAVWPCIGCWICSTGFFFHMTATASIYVTKYTYFKVDIWLIIADDEKWKWTDSCNRQLQPANNSWSTSSICTRAW